jgi:hypothetical protein
MAATPGRAVGVGVGAGAFEAMLLGFAGAAAALLAGLGVTSWSVALAPAAERVIAILCHVAARVLVLMAVATGKWQLFWYGFLLLSGLDAVAMYLHLSGQVGTMSSWMMEAMLAPFGLISIPIVLWCIKHWPRVVHDTVTMAHAVE